MWSEKVIELINSHKNESKYIGIVGGCALNGITNYQLEKSNLFDKVHYIPNPTDCGLSVGASYLMYYKLTNNKKKTLITSLHTLAQSHLILQKWIF